jgi:hypothetical protein
MTTQAPQAQADATAERIARRDRTEDAETVSREIAIYGEVRTEEGTEAAGRLCGYLIDSLGLTA